MRKRLLGAVAIAAGIAVACQASARDVSFTLSGSYDGGTISAVGNFILSANPNAANTAAGDYNGWWITGISGTFTDTGQGWNNVPIAGLAKAAGNTPTDDPMTPNSFQWVVNNPDDEFDPNNYSWDNLFFPTGSAWECTDAPIGGGLLDIYGVLFKLGGAAEGTVVNLWSNGQFSPAFADPSKADPNNPLYGPAFNGAPVYALKYVNGVDPGGLTLTAQVPEPSTWAMMGLGFAGLGLAGVRAKRKAAAQA